MSPDIPPEAEVIRLAREAMDMTAQAAAEASRAHDGKGVSAAYWRDVERGYGGLRGQRVPTRASARALAAIAGVVGVIASPAHQSRGARMQPACWRRSTAVAVSVLHLPASDTPPPPEGFLEAADIAAARPYADRINARLRELALDGIARPSGGDIFGSGTRSARTWDVWSDEIEAGQLIWLVAALQEREARAQGRGRNTG